MSLYHIDEKYFQRWSFAYLTLEFTKSEQFYMLYNIIFWEYTHTPTHAWELYEYATDATVTLK